MSIRSRKELSNSAFIDVTSNSDVRRFGGFVGSDGTLTALAAAVTQFSRCTEGLAASFSDFARFRGFVGLHDTLIALIAGATTFSRCTEGLATHFNADLMEVDTGFGDVALGVERVSIRFMSFQISSLEFPERIKMSIFSSIAL